MRDKILRNEKKHRPNPKRKLETTHRISHSRDPFDLSHYYETRNEGKWRDGESIESNTPSESDVLLVLLRASHIKPIFRVDK